jgi:cytoskeletal protein CcmA (bactofilin family)
MNADLLSRGYRGKQRNEGGFALVSAILFLFVVLVLGSSIVWQSVQEVKRASRAKKETDALNLAEAGIDYAAWKLYHDRNMPLPVTWTRSDLDVGTFTVTASVYDAPNNTVMVNSTGTTQGWPAQVKVIGKFLPTGPDEQNAVFGYGLFSNADMTVSGSFNITGHVHSNGNVTAKGGATVDGNVEATGTYNSQGNPNISGTTTSGAPRVAMPTIDLAYYLSKATTILNGDQTLNGASLDGVTYINGNASIHGQFSGKGVIVVTGSVEINANCSLAQSGDEFAIVSAGSVRVNGTCTIDGWIYTHNVDVPGAFAGNGNATINGGVIADVLNVNGNLTVHYNTATVDLPGNIAAPAQLDAVSWRRVK